jgi:hypothetical protein
MGAAGWWQDPDPGGVRLVRAWCLPYRRGPAAASSATAGSGRPERCDGGRAGGRRLADAQERRRQLPAAAAQGGRYRAGPVAGAGGCTQAEPPAASLPLLCDGMTSGSARPGPSRAACGLKVAGLHRVTAAARPGSARQLPSGTGLVSRDAAARASWAPAIVMTASVRICSSGSPGSWPLAAADVRCLRPLYTRTRKLANFFRNLISCRGGQLDLPDLSRPGSPARRPSPRDTPARHRSQHEHHRTQRLWHHHGSPAGALQQQRRRMPGVSPGQARRVAPTQGVAKLRLSPSDSSAGAAGPRAWPGRPRQASACGVVRASAGGRVHQAAMASNSRRTTGNRGEGRY